jgi:hypothetical protein
LVAAAHARGLEVMVWVLKKAGLDHEQTWRALASRGVDLFTSDLPDGAAAWYKQHLRSRACAPSDEENRAVQPPLEEPLEPAADMQ